MEAWPPTRFTSPLTPDFKSAIDPLLPAIQFIWLRAFGYELEVWQVELLRAILELKPDGTFRHRQALVSMGRQNGKTEIAAALGLWRLLDSRSLVIGIASTADQARIVYERAMDAVKGNPSLGKRFRKLTETRGIATIEGGKYEIKAAKGAALQGLPIDLGICDEVHLLKTELWTALVNGTGGRDNCLVVGITTAGDETSELLKMLYDQGESGQIGFFCWEAPDIEFNDDNLADYLKAANPSIASGRVSLSNAIDDSKTLPAPDLIRYKLNRFTASQHQFIPIDMWAACSRGIDEVFPEGNPVFCIDRTPDWGFAAITANIKVDELIHTELVASIAKPSLEDLVEVCVKLARHSPQTYVVDNFALRDLGNELKLRGLPVTFSTQADAMNASSTLYAKVRQKKVRHSSDPVLSLQIPRAVRKNVGEGFRISRQDSSYEIDGVMATTLGVYFADTQKPMPMQLF